MNVAAAGLAAILCAIAVVCWVCWLIAGALVPKGPGHE